MGAQTYANMVSSATWGTFCCCQLICYVGYHRNWYSTFPVSVLAASLGVAGCEEAGCWSYLFTWTVIGGCGIVVQLYTGWTDRKDLKTINVETWYGKIYYQLHRAFQLMLDVEASMAEHCQPHSAAELRELSDTYAATWAAVTTTASNVALLTFGLSLCAGALEMLFRLIMHGMAFYIFVTGAIAVCFTLYSMQIRDNVTVDEHIKHMDIYIWGVFVCVPISVTGFFISLTLGLDADPLGLHTQFGVNEFVDEAGESGAKMRTWFMRHMQSAAVAFAGLAVSSAITCTGVSKSLGGWLYLTRKLEKFVSDLIIIIGIVVINYSTQMMPDREEYDGAWIFGLIVFSGIVMIGTGIIGAIGGRIASRSIENKSRDQREKNQCLRDFNLKLFAALLLLILIVNLLVFVLAALWAGDIQNTVATDWEHINVTMSSYCKGGDAGEKCHLTQEEFVDSVQSSFQLIMAVGVSTSMCTSISTQQMANKCLLG